VVFKRGAGGGQRKNKTTSITEHVQTLAIAATNYRGIEPTSERAGS
jgi:hypothetical protein